MAITKQEKSDIFQQFKISDNDTGSAEVQCAVLTAEILALTEHLKIHKKDFSTRHGLIRKVTRRNKILKYIKNKSEDKYLNITSALNIRVKKTL